MKKNVLIPLGILSMVLLFPSSTFAFVPLICDLCTIGVIAGLSISRYLGVDDSVVGVWIGACLVALIGGTVAYMEKKNIRYPFRNTSIAAMFVAFTGISFYYAGVIGVYRNTFFRSTSIFLDKILISSIVGALVLVASASLYQWMKRRHGGAYFPFQKVVMPIASLIAASAVFYFITLR